MSNSSEKMFTKVGSIYRDFDDNFVSCNALFLLRHLCVTDTRKQLCTKALENMDGDLSIAHPRRYTYGLSLQKLGMDMVSDFLWSAFLSKCMFLIGQLCV